jgi:serine/threonine protein kinase
MTPDRTNLGMDEIILEDQIGSGSFSEVYKGKWLGTTVAIKRFLLNQTASSIENEEVLTDFMKETSLMAGLRQ